jgi:ectoine hydroxylase
MKDMTLSPAQVGQFARDGYLFVPELLDSEETAMLFAAARNDARIREHSFGVVDASGRQSRLAGWNHPGDDIYGMIARSHCVVDAMELLLGGEVYHYHSKMMLKEPRVGGAWEWHQDYGYWYQNGCLYPDMASCMIAVDRASKENGCLQVLRGSHRIGRIEHGRFGGQNGADPERVQVAMKRLDLVFCEMEPGTGLFFHANLLHCSSPNNSDSPRWSLICCYNAASNDPYRESHHPRYTPLSKVPNRVVKEVGAKATSPAQVFVDPGEDKTVVATKEK